MMQFYDAKVPVVSRQYLVRPQLTPATTSPGSDNEVKVPWKFGQKGKWADFQPDALRRIGTK
jgi:hypothetical protein